jgi:hypothetical protein
MSGRKNNLNETGYGQLDISSVPAGIYILKCTDSNGIEITALIVKK